MNRSLSMTKGSTSCYGGIQQGSNTLSIWGDVFLKSQFTVFDGRTPPRIGFARQNSLFNVPTPYTPPRVEIPPTSPKPLVTPTGTTISIPGVVVPGPGPIMTLGAIAPIKPVETTKKEGENWMMGLFYDLAARWRSGGGGAESNGVIGRNKRMVGRFRYKDVVE